ncbi:MAG TPA: epimerase [Polaromonas sp.]|uniref:epimerase n=1 Tax=Polaromonas sp. TaxID=1869339 RepID=UPI002D3BBDE9|nr:epimerase [Polaromonas sp.]HYW56651.1 epimerase [Polaromonas sp.]
MAHVTDSLSGFVPPAVNDVFIALGTTIKTAGSQQAFRAVDFDAVVALAQSARAAGATRIGIVSAMGADARSTVFYNRVKGEMEEAVVQMGYEAVIFARPSLLKGDREALAQSTRPGEKAALVAMTLFKPLIPANYRAIAAADVANALVSAVDSGPTGNHVLLSGAMQPG